jgi:hypothetical protein
MPLPGLLYAQVVKTVRRWRLVNVKHRVMFGTLDAVNQVLAPLGWQINTAFVERLNLTIRQHVAAAGRRVSTLCKGEDGLRQQLAVFHCYYNFCLPHMSLRRPLSQSEPTNGTRSAKPWRPCTPAMVVGLTDPVIDKASCFQELYSSSTDRGFPADGRYGTHLGGSSRGEQDMHRRMTNSDHGALDAYPHSFASAWALR